MRAFDDFVKRRLIEQYNDVFNERSQTNTLAEACAENEDSENEGQKEQEESKEPKQAALFSKLIPNNQTLAIWLS